MAKKRPGQKSGPKIGPKKKRSRKTVPDSSSDPVAEQEIILELDNKGNLPDFICPTDTESEEDAEQEPKIKPSKVRGFMDQPVPRNDQNRTMIYDLTKRIVRESLIRL